MTTASQIVAVFNRLFMPTHFTELVGGGGEPWYTPAMGDTPARVVFRDDFVRSALHEVAHWCIAGAARRNLPDYGYWYSPDDRDLRQQRAFFAVEARPQALERHFCEALGLGFSPSVDNLTLVMPIADAAQFEKRLQDQYQRLEAQGLPPRALRFRDALASIATHQAA